jgi:hypothetical protein
MRKKHRYVKFFQREAILKWAFSHSCFLCVSQMGVIATLRNPRRFLARLGLLHAWLWV